MSKEDVIEIKVQADTSDLEKDIENASRKIDKQTDKMEKSFDELSKTLDKVKKNMNNAFSTNTSNFSGLTTQLNKLSNVATTVGNKIKSTLQKAFNVEGKVKVQQEVQTTNTSNSGSGGNGSALADALMTGGTIGAMMNKELAQMSKSISSIIPKSHNKQERIYLSRTSFVALIRVEKSTSSPISSILFGAPIRVKMPSISAFLGISSLTLTIVSSSFPVPLFNFTVEADCNNSFLN